MSERERGEGVEERNKDDSQLHVITTERCTCKVNELCLLRICLVVLGELA